jgi:hypothetical protein
MTLSANENHGTTPVMRKEPYSIRLDPKQREALEAHAKSQHRPLANLVEMILTEWLAQAGAPPAPPKAAKGRAR